MSWPCIVSGPIGAPAIVLLHGMPGTSRDWSPMIAKLAKDYRVFAPDYPGFGANPAPMAGDASLLGRAEAVRGFLDEHGLCSAAVMAHSMGGATALQLAARYPRRVSALVLLASVGLRRHAALLVPPHALGRLLPIARRSRLSRLVTWRVLRRVYRSQRLGGAETLTQQQALWHLELFARLDFRALRAAASRVRCPALVVYATDDRLVAPAISSELAAAIQGAGRLVLSKGGHALPQRHGAELADAVLAMLTQAHARPSHALGGLR